MPEQQTVLLLGGTGRTGRRVLEQLLNRGVNVRAIVRSAAKLPVDPARERGLAVLEADLLSMSDEALSDQVRGCDAVISCLGHVISLRGVFGPPYNLVTQATGRLCRAIEAQRPARRVKFILMSSVSVNHPRSVDERRGAFEKAVLWLLRGSIPPAGDNQRASDHLWRSIGMANPFVEWVAVRPDTLLEGPVSDYTVHEGLVSGLFAPRQTNRANVAHFMCELATNQATWEDWKGKLPVIINEVARG